MISVVVSDGSIDTLINLSNDESKTINDFSDEDVKSVIEGHYNSYFTKLVNTIPGLSSDVIKNVVVRPICIIDSTNLKSRFFNHISISLNIILDNVIKRRGVQDEKV